jgi:hypothetical protein
MAWTKWREEVDSESLSWENPTEGNEDNEGEVAGISVAILIPILAFFSCVMPSLPRRFRRRL